MWRSYDMVDGTPDPELTIVDHEPALESVESAKAWLMPRLVSRVEAERCDRMVRIPPGFLSC